MRVSSRGYMDTIKRNIALPSERIEQLYGQLSSGKRLGKLSDDPMAAMRSVRLHAQVGELAARQYVIQQGQALLGATDTALGQIGDLLGQCRDIGLRATAPQLSDSQRSALAAQVRAVQASLVLQGNTEVQGRYLFAGSQTATAPFEAAAGANLPVLYHGDHKQLAFQISPTEQTAVGFTGAKVFNYPDATGVRPQADVDADVFSLLDDLANAIETGDTATIESLTPMVQELQEHVVGLRGQAGVLSQRHEQALSAAEDADVRLHELLSAEESLDMAAALADLSTQQTIYQAALSLTAQVLQMPNLFELAW